MRISTTQLYTSATRSMVEGQAKLADIQAKIASGKNFTSLAEDPVGANQVVSLKREIAQLDMFNTNVDAARRRLELGETTLDNLNIALDRARELSIQAANNTLTDVDRQTISYELEQIVNYAANLMNSRDAKGEYIFSGSKGTTQAYQLEAGRYVYQGDTGSREIQVGSSVFVESTDPGKRIFESVSGTPSLKTDGNLAAAIVDYEVTDPIVYRQLVKQTGDISLSVTRVTTDAGATSMAYSILDSAGKPLASADGESLGLVLYDDTQAAPETVEVALNGVTLTLSLPASAELDDEPLLTNLTPTSTSLSLAVVDAAELTQFVELGNTGLQLRVLEDSGVFTYEVASNLGGEPLATGSWNPSIGEVAPAELITLAGMDASIAPEANIGIQLGVAAGDEVLKNTFFAVKGPLTLNVSEAGGVYTYDLRDKANNIVQDQVPADVAGSWSAGDVLPSFNFNGFTITLAPDASYPQVQSNWELDPATDLSNISVVTSNTGLLEDVRLIDPTDLAAFMLGNDVASGAGRLELSISYDEGVYNWSLLNDSGSELESGTYRDPSIGAIGTGVELSTAQALTDFSFALEVNGQRSGAITLPDGSYSTTGLVSSLQSEIDKDPLLAASGIEVSYTDTTGLVFTSADLSDELQFAAVAANDLGIISTTNSITVTPPAVDGFELDMLLPIDQASATEYLTYQAPLSARISFEQEDTNILNALLETIDTLQTPSQGDVEAMATLNEQMALILNQLNEAQERLSDSMATMGARMRNLDSIEFGNIDFKLMTQSTLSAVEDLDYAAASTELARKQLALEASFASFAKIQGLTLFDYIR